MVEGLNEHIERSFNRLSSEKYNIKNVWKDEHYDWAGDWEGRALLAFVCMYEITGKKIPCMDTMIKDFPLHANKKGYLGKIEDGIANEQQLSGHSWLLRGFLGYYNAFGDENALSYARDVVKNLYVPLIGLYDKYPAEGRADEIGGVGGNISSVSDGWKLSTDVGCAYMCIDGLSDYYAVTKDEETKKILDILIEDFMLLDRVKIKCQTHATLSAARGILRLYKVTGDKKYFNYAVSVFEFYVKHGMTLTYENFNWFGREDTWTEPCTIVDSFILASELYNITGEERYKTLASRIWYNGLRFCHRANGGAGPNTCVTKTQPYLGISFYEAAFCCTMRYAEGLKFVCGFNENIVSSEEISEDEYGRVFMGNELFVIDESGSFPNAEKYVYDGKTYIKIPTFVKKGKYKLRVC